MIRIRIPQLVVTLFLLLFCSVQCAPASTLTNSSDSLVVSGRWVREFGIVTPAMIDQLRNELWIQVSPSKKEDPGLVLLSPREVISARRRYPELSTLAGVKMARIQRLTLGTAPEFVEVGKNYVLFYEGVVRGAWSMVLNQRLKRADHALKQLSRQTLARETYLTEFEKNMSVDQKSGGDAPGGELIPGLEKSRIEAYIDEAEKRFDKP